MNNKRILIHKLSNGAMAKTFALAALCMMATMLVGCGWMVEEDAKKIVVPAPQPHRMMHTRVDQNAKMIAEGKITSFGRAKAPDGTEIAYWIIRHRSAATSSAETRGTALLIHPLLTDCEWFLDVGQKLADRNWDVVLVDLRAHGQSGGDYVTWGAKEKYDLKAVMDKLLAQQAVSDKIYAFGASLGGCVAIQYGAIDERCRGVVSVCPPASVRDVARRILFMCSERDLDARLKRAGELAKFDISDASAVEAAKKLRCPLILVHGEWDMVVPYQHSEIIFNAAPPPKMLIPLPWSNHFTAQVWRDDWLVQQIEAVAQLATTTQPATVTPAAE